MTTPAHPDQKPSPASLPTPSPLGVAAIGYAFMGKAHSNAWRNVASFFDVPAFEQKVLVGRDATQVAEAEAKYGWAESATDWRSVIERDDIHIIDICAPGWMHAEIAIVALAAGKHVLVEKPLANTIAEAEAMTAAAMEARALRVQSMIGFNYRRVPALALARELVAEGRLGTVRHVRAAYLQDWLSDAESPMTWGSARKPPGPARWATSPPTPSTRSCSSWAMPSPRSPAACTPSWTAAPALMVPRAGSRM